MDNYQNILEIMDIDMYLTVRQKEIFNYIKGYIEKNDMPPSYTEIMKHFSFNSLSTVNDHIENLKKKGYITKGFSNQKRSISLVEREKTAYAVSIPLLGIVRAGEPIDVCEITEYINVPKEMLANGENAAFKINGLSMVDDGIYPDDIIIVKLQNTAENSQIVVALLNNRATVKRIYYHKNQIELRPRNSEMKSIFVGHNDDLEIRGILTSLYRKY